MKLEVLTLENMNVHTIYQVFEDAFTDYIVKFEKNPALHIERWLSAGVDFTLSYGVKCDGVLGAFLLHAPRGELAMNLATGVRRIHQGKGLTGLMYERIRADLPSRGYLRGRLEVITENHRAIRAYEKSGFRRGRFLRSWKGTAGALRASSGHYSFRQVVLTEEHRSLSPYSWAFEQSTEVIERRKGKLELHELREGNTLLAYAVWNPGSMNLVQLAGKDRDRVMGLLSAMKLSGEHFGMINVPEESVVNAVLSQAGLVNFLNQYEMEMAF